MSWQFYTHALTSKQSHHFVMCKDSGKCTLAREAICSAYGRKYYGRRENGIWWKVNNTWPYLATQLFRGKFLSRNRAYSFPFQGKMKTQTPVTSSAQSSESLVKVQPSSPSQCYLPPTPNPLKKQHGAVQYYNLQETHIWLFS